MRQHRLQLGGEDDLVGQHRVVERLDAEAIAREHQRLRRLVPHGQAEHALEILEGVAATHLPGVDDGLRVRAGPEDVAGGGETAGQLTVVVDLAVEDDPRAAVLAGHRLMAGVEIDDVEAPDAEPGRPADDEAGTVRTTMGETIGHRFENRLVGPPVGARQDVAHDATHERYSTPCIALYSTRTGGLRRALKHPRRRARLGHFSPVRTGGYVPCESSGSSPCWPCSARPPPPSPRNQRISAATPRARPSMRWQAASARS